MKEDGAGGVSLPFPGSIPRRSQRLDLAASILCFLSIFHAFKGPRIGSSNTPCPGTLAEYWIRSAVAGLTIMWGVGFVGPQFYS